MGLEARKGSWPHRRKRARTWPLLFMLALVLFLIVLLGRLS